MNAADIERLNAVDIRQVLNNLPATRRQALLDDSEAFRDVVRQEARNRSLKAAAYANDLQREANVRFLMARAADNALRELYLERLMNEQLPDDFPDDTQIRTYYEQQHERFMTVERLQVWQIFLPLTGDAAQAEADKVANRIDKLYANIRDGAIDFGQAAFEHSQHAGSRQNNGYMGALAQSELKPQFAAALAPLEPGQITRVQSEDGWHILKKGRTIEPRQLSLAEAGPQIRELLRQEAEQQFRAAVYEQAAVSYPYMPSENRTEQWRLEMKTGLQPLPTAIE